MKYNVSINQKQAVAWGLNLPESFMFAYLYELPAWADAMVIGNRVFYFASRNLATRQIPLLSSKNDTIYRYYKKLQEYGLIIHVKVGIKDYISLTEKTKDWNTDIFKEDGFKSEQSRKIIRETSDLNPTYYSIIDNNIIDKGGQSSLNLGYPKGFVEPKIEEVIEYFQKNGSDENRAKIAYDYYREGKWHDSKGNAVINWKQKMLINFIKKDQGSNQGKKNLNQMNYND